MLLVAGGTEMSIGRERGFNHQDVSAATQLRPLAAEKHATKAKLKTSASMRIFDKLRNVIIAGADHAAKAAVKTIIATPHGNDKALSNKCAEANIINDA